MRAFRSALLGLLGAAALGAGGLPERPPSQASPIELELEERVDVQLVLVDVVVTDRQGRSVEGLGAERFELRVGGSRRAITAVDEHCPAGGSDDPSPLEVARLGGNSRSGLFEKLWEPLPETILGMEAATAGPLPADLDAGSRLVVIALDFYNIPSLGFAFDELRRALDERFVEGDLHVIVALAEGLRIESPFTTDRAVLVETLERMESDPTLYAGNFERLTEFRVFEALQMLMDLLETFPGRKVVALYSGPFRNDGFFQDPQFRKLGATAARARASIYPVNSAGMNGALRPPDLNRLALETGGRITSGTNDISLGYARAGRDLRCGYTIAFLDRDPTQDRSRRLRIDVDGEGLRVHHPAFYALRSERKQRRAWQRTATMAPELFDEATLELAVDVSAPISRRRREVTFSIVDAEIATEEGWKIEGNVRAPSGAVMSRFGDELTERFRLRPGRYKLTATAWPPGEGEPRVGALWFEVPPIPR